MPSENVTTKFKVDISDLKKNIAEANRQVKQYKAEMANASAGMKKGEETANSLTAKIEAQSKIVEAEKAKLQAMKEELSRYESTLAKGESSISELTRKHEEAAKAFGEDSEQAKKLAKQLADAQAAQERNAKAADDLRLKITNQDTAVKTAQSRLGDFQTALSETTRKESSLTETVAKQESELKDLKQRYTDVAAAQGKDSTEAKALASQISSLSAELKTNQDKLDSAEQSANSFDKSLKQVDETSEKTTSGGLNAFTVAIGNLAANLLTAAIQKLEELGKTAIKAFEDFDAGRDALIKATGATGEAAAEMTEAYSNAVKSISGDLTSIGSAVGEVNTRFGYTGENLTKVSEDFLKFAEITGMDAVSAVQGVSRALESAGMDMEQYPELLDKIAVASQASGISADKLTDSLTTYGAQMRAIGYDTDDTIAMLAQFEKSGVNTETTLSGLRKANAAWAKDGKDARQEFAALISEIKSTPDSTDAAGKAVEAFGTKAGAELADAIRSGRFEFDAFAETVADSAGVVEKTYEETQSGIDKIKLAVQGLSVTFGEAAGKIVDEFAPKIENIISLFGSVLEGDQTAENELADAVSDFLTAAFDKAVSALPELSGFASRLLGKLADALAQSAPSAVETLTGILTTVLDTAGELLPQLADTFTDNLPDVFDKLFDALPQIMDAVSKFVQKIAERIPTVLQKIIVYLPKLVQKAADILVNNLPVLVQSVMQIVTGLVQALPDAVRAVIDALPQILKTLGDALPELLTGVFTALSECTEPLIDAAVTMVNALVGMLPQIIAPLVKEMPEIVAKLMAAAAVLVPKALEALDAAMQQIVSALPEILQTLWDSLTELLDPFAKIMADVWLGIEDSFRDVGAFFSGIWEESVNNTEDIIETIVGFFAGIWDSIKAVFDSVGEFFEGIFEKTVQNTEDAISGVVDFFRNIWDGIQDVFSSVGTFFKGVWDEAVQNTEDVISGTVDFFREIWRNIKDVFSGVSAFFSGIWEEAVQNTEDAFSGIAEFFSGIWDDIKTKFTDIGTKIGDAVGGAFKTAVNAVLKTVENSLNFVPTAINNAIDLLNQLPGVNIPIMGEIRLPRLEKGGIVGKSTLAQIGENGREAIIPLEKNKAGLKEIAHLLAEEIGTVKIHAPVENITNAGTTVNMTQNISSPKALSQYEIWRQTQNMLELVKLQGV
jgi:TP901 family phage tail tape measure protein